MSSYEDQAPQGRGGRTGWAELGSGGTVKLANPGSRFLARILDITFLVIVSAVVFASSIDWSEFSEQIDAESPDFADVGPGAGVLWVLLAIGLLYEILPVATWGRTLGKKIAGIKIVNAHTGEVPGLRRAFLRWVVPSVLTAVQLLTGNSVLSVLATIWWLVCYLSLFFDRVYQGWHDKAAGTLVIKPQMVDTY